MLRKLSKLSFQALIILFVLSEEFACKALIVGDCEGFSWSPNGKQIALKTENAIYVMNTENFQRYKVDSRNAERGYTSAPPAWSPDGKQILFTTVSRTTDTRGISQIYIVSKDGLRNSRLLVDNGSSPQWSPDGKHIVFQSYKDGRWEIYIMTADGSKLTKLASDSTPYKHPLWSPDSKLIIYSISPTVDKTEIYVAAVSGLEKPKKIKNGSSAIWSSDGKEIAYISSTLEVHIFNRKNSKDSQVYRLPVSRVYKSGLEWGAGNSHLFAWFISCKEGRKFSYNDCELKIDTIDLKYSKRIGQMSFDSVGNPPIWSFDKSKIGYISLGFLYKINADGSQVKKMN